MKKLLALCFACMTLSVQAQNFKLGGFTETVFIVSDLEAMQAFFENVGGYEVRHQDAPQHGLKKLWQLPEKAKITQRLMANKGENRGYIRLIHIEGVEQKTMRMHSQAWDIGGIFDVNVRVLDMETKQQELEALGWQSDTLPLQFSFGPFEVKEWIVRGPDGVAFALIERLKPTLEGWPNIKEFSRVFNSTQVVADIEKSAKFYREILGFQDYLTYRGASKGTGENVLGLPYNMAKTVERSVYILHPEKKNEGSVELLQFHGAEGQDLSDLARPPNLGIATLRFPVDNLESLKAAFVKNNIKIQSEVNLTLAPYGDVKVLAILSPDNTWLEFYQTMATH